MRVLLLFGTTLASLSFHAMAVYESEHGLKERDQGDRSFLQKTTSQNTEKQKISAAFHVGTDFVDPQQGTLTVAVNEDGSSNTVSDPVEHGDMLQCSQQAASTKSANNFDATIISKAIHKATIDLANLDVIEEMITGNYVDLDSDELSDLMKDIQAIQENASREKENYYDTAIGTIRREANAETEVSRYELLYYIDLNLKKAEAILQKLYGLRVKSCFPQLPSSYALERSSRFPKISTSTLKASTGGRQKKVSHIVRLPSINESRENL